MVILAAIWCLGQVSVRHDRITFFNALLKVKQGWTKDQVRHLLGAPDQVITGEDLVCQMSPNQESWQYGTHGWLSLPTLGQVRFENSKVITVPARASEPPLPLAVVGDDELTELLERIDAKWRDPEAASDPAYLLRLAHILWPLGQKKALAVLSEFNRLGGIGNDSFWLLHLLFEPTAPPGYFEVPSIGAITPKPPQKMRDWPDYPLAQIDGIPFSLLGGILLGGFPEPLDWYVKTNIKDWRWRTSLPTPPDDPFLSFVKFQGRKSEVKGLDYTPFSAAEQFSALLRSVPGITSNELLTNGGFERAHQTW